MYRWPHASKRASASARATSILSVIPGCRGTRAESSAPSTSIMVCLFFQIPTPITSVRNRSTSTPCASPHASCGASRPVHTILSALTCGMTTLTQLDPIRQPQILADLPQLPRDDGGPVFAEPWQAQAFALAVKLSEQGHFTWKECAAALAAELKAAADRGEPDDGSHYYDHWLATLARLLNST